MVNVVGVICDRYTGDVRAQLTRDLLLLSASWDIAVYDPASVVDDAVLASLDVARAGGTPVLTLVYKTGDVWPEAPMDWGNVVKRDMKPELQNGNLSKGVGYFLRPQGKGVTNKTEQYLSRSRPKGIGTADPMITLLWG